MKTCTRKKYLRLISGLLTLCVAVLIFPAARAAEPGRTIKLEGEFDMLKALQDARDGDTIVLSNNVVITDKSSKDAPWVIDKAVTIQGGVLLLRAGGIILEKDVTFRDTILSFDLFIRNAILANGHTLTLENVSCDQSSQQVVNLFCGGLYDPEGFGSTPGAAGRIIIKGNTSLKNGNKVGNLYAGNLCMGGLNEADSHINGPANQYHGTSSIQIESATAALGDIYGGGAQQRIPVGSGSGKVILTDPAQYTAAGPVDIRLTGGSVKYVDGAGGGNVRVTYNGTDYSVGLTVKNVSGLAVETGSLALAAGSGLPANAALGVGAGTRLDLTNLDNVTVGSFSGGGTLLLGQSQSLAVAGSVTGQTTVGIFSLNASGCSTMPPISEHPYLRALQSGPDAFVLAPPVAYPELQLVRSENGDWSVPASDAPVLVESAAFAQAQSSIGSGEYAELGLDVTYVENDAPAPALDFLPLTVVINGDPANRTVDDYGYYVYTTSDNKLTIEVIDDTLGVTGADGTYSIELIIPGTNTATGQPLSAQTVLTIGEATAPVESLAYQIRSLTADDAQVTAEIAVLNAETAGDATVFAAAYTQGGRMCAVSAVPMTGEGTLSIPLDSSGADYVTVFILDGMDSLKPVCRKRSAMKNGQLV